MLDVPITPALVPLVSPIVLEKVISPAPADAFTFNPPSSFVAPIAPVKVTSPAPDVIVKISSFSASVDSSAAPKVTSPLPVPVLIVVVPSLARSTPEVLKATLSPVVVKAALLPVISILPPPVTAV